MLDEVVRCGFVQESRNQIHPSMGETIMDIVCQEKCSQVWKTFGGQRVRDLSVYGVEVERVTV